MDIDKPVTARQMAWILWGPVAAIGLLALMIYMMKETRIVAPVSASDQNMTELTSEQLNLMTPAELENSMMNYDADMIPARP